MPNGLQYLDQAQEAIKDIAGLGSELSNAIAKGEEQVTTPGPRNRNYQRMCDALQLAADLISKELSAGVTEFNRLRQAQEGILRG